MALWICSGEVRLVVDGFFCGEVRDCIVLGGSAGVAVPCAEQLGFVMGCKGMRDVGISGLASFGVFEPTSNVIQVRVPVIWKI